MISRVRNPKDFWAGLIYLALGLSAVYIAQEYRMGTALKMGPGYFPTTLGGLLALIGTLSLVRSFIRPGEPIRAFALKGLLLIVAGTALTGFLIRHAGLLIALPLLIVITAYGSIKFRWATALALAAGLTLFCAVVFVKALRLPVPLLGTWFN